jgi:uncharacterized caspase-like protein
VEESGDLARAGGESVGSGSVPLKGYFMIRGTKPPKSGVVVTVVCLLAALSSAAASAETRVIVWASDYSKARDRNLELPNTLVDARAVTDMFRKLKIGDLNLVENPKAEQLNSAVDSLVERMQPDDVAVLYYAGHAVQVNGQNFFLAADGTTLVSSEQVLAPIMAKAKGTVFLIDACRDNPFRSLAVKSEPVPARAPAKGEVFVSAGPKNRQMQTVSLTQLAQAQGGLSQMSNLRGKNTIVVFSTDPGNVALDGPAGKGSPFANAVVRELGKRQSLDVAIRRITEDVDKQTTGKQSPWRQGDLTFPLFLGGQPRFPVP